MAVSLAWSTDSIALLPHRGTGPVGRATAVAGRHGGSAKRLIHQVNEPECSRANDGVACSDHHSIALLPRRGAGPLAEKSTPAALLAEHLPRSPEPGRTVRGDRIPR